MISWVSYTPREKIESFWHKKFESLAELKFNPSKWITGEYLSQFDSQCGVNLILNVESIWFSMLSQFDSQCWANLALNVEAIWLSMLSQFGSQCWGNLTLNVEPIWLSMLSQFGSQCWVNLTLNVEAIWLKYSPVTDFAGLNFSSASDSTF